VGSRRCCSIFAEGPTEGGVSPTLRLLVSMNMPLQAPSSGGRWVRGLPNVCAADERAVRTQTTFVHVLPTYMHPGGAVPPSTVGASHAKHERSAAASVIGERFNVVCLGEVPACKTDWCDARLT